jgi:hypothetical protein
MGFGGVPGGTARMGQPDSRHTWQTVQRVAPCAVEWSALVAIAIFALIRTASSRDHAERVLAEDDAKDQ